MSSFKASISGRSVARLAGANILLLLRQLKSIGCVQFSPGSSGSPTKWTYSGLIVRNNAKTISVGCFLQAPSSSPAVISFEAQTESSHIHYTRNGRRSTMKDHWSEPSVARTSQSLWPRWGALNNRDVARVQCGEMLNSFNWVTTMCICGATCAPSVSSPSLYHYSHLPSFHMNVKLPLWELCKQWRRRLSINSCQCEYHSRESSFKSVTDTL